MKTRGEGGASRNWQKQLFQILLPVGGDVKLLDREAGVDSEAPGPASAGASGGDDETGESEGDALEEEGSYRISYGVATTRRPGAHTEDCPEFLEKWEAYTSFNIVTWGGAKTGADVGVADQEDMEEPRSRIFLPSRCQSLSTPTVEEEVQGWLKTFLWILEDDQAVASIKKVLALVLGQLGMTIDRSLHKVNSENRIRDRTAVSWRGAPHMSERELKRKTTERRPGEMYENNHTSLHSACPTVSLDGLSGCQMGSWLSEPIHIESRRNQGTSGPSQLRE
ncbi:hypothetical protein Acr_00g0001060 [Actinidia rufa]|uniref:Uncharacterized protein n=1 Tax=Actinidia rufa TaxID=165716 RepID=A0A7J0D6I5_9ERIC|nr:hypothetical protein Acr_00g0001060 [Actinidia rufa]